MSKFDTIAQQQINLRNKPQGVDVPKPSINASARPDIVDSISNIFGDPSIFQDCGDEVALYRNLLRDRVLLVERGEDPSPKLLRACQRYVNRFKKRVEILERRGGESGEAHLRRTHWASKAAFFFDRPFATKWSFAYFIFITAIILFSCIAVILQSVPQFNPQLFDSYRVLWAQGDIFSSLLLLFDRCTQIVAGISDPDAGPQNILKKTRKVFFQPSVIVDLLACIIPLFLALSSTPGGSGSILDLVVLLRVYRILMSLRHFDAFEDLTDTLQSSAPALAAPLVGLFVILFGVSSIIFTFEGGTFMEDTKQFMTKVDDCIMSAEYLKGRTECPRVESKFVSAVHTIWFTLITFLTVGYGDLVPLTQAGRLVAAVAIFIGMLFVAIPIAIVGSNFTETVERLRTERLLVGQWMERDRETARLEIHKADVQSEMTKAAPIPSLSFVRFLRMNMKKTFLNLKTPSRTARYLCELYLTRVVEVFKDPINSSSLRMIFERARVTKRPYSARLQLIDTHQRFPPVPLMRPVCVSVGSSPTCDIVLSDAVIRKLRGVQTASGQPLLRIPNVVASRHAVISLLPFAGTAETAKVDAVQPFQAWLIGSKGNRITFANNEEAMIYIGKPPPSLLKRRDSAKGSFSSKNSKNRGGAGNQGNYRRKRRNWNNNDDDDDELLLDLDHDEDDEDEDQQSEFDSDDAGSENELGEGNGISFGVNLEFGRKFSIIQLDNASITMSAPKSAASFMIPR